MFTLIATTDKSEGTINVPVLDTMTNEQMAEAILSRFKPRKGHNLYKDMSELKYFVKTLRNDPDGVYINPCYDVMQMDDCFVCSFEFVEA